MLRIGISGWTYGPWRGVFYPQEIPQRRHLAYAAEKFSTVEINGSFYSLQRPESYARWYQETPPGFVFSVKGPRFVTHMKKLRGVEEALANFFASGPLRLREKLGPILWQLPPQLPYDAQRMEDFFVQLPRDTHAMAALARQHGPRLDGRAATEAQHEALIRHCVEVRHPSFLVPEFIQQLRRHQVAFVLADTGGRWPYTEDLTADFVYIRLHGPEELYVSGYDSGALDWWASRLLAWDKNKQPTDARNIIPRPRLSPRVQEVYVYFDNDAKVRAPQDAQELIARLPVQNAKGGVKGKA